MRSLFKFPLLSLVCAVSLNAVASRSALAGQEGITLPGSGSSGVADTFAPGDVGPSLNVDPNQLFSSRIYNGLSNSLNTIGQRASVTRLNGQSLPISSTQIDNLATLFLGSQPSSSIISGLEQQLATEMGEQIISLSPSGNTAGDLQMAINSANALIMNLDSQQLAAVSQSPTFLAILELLEEGGEYLANNRSDARFARDGSSTFNLINMSLAEVVEVTPEPVQRQPEPRIVEPPAPPAPRTEPGFQEPVRGLW